MCEYTCPICLQTLSDPVRLRTGHVYDRHCIATWFRSRMPPHRCPLSNMRLDSIELLPAPDVRSEVLAWALERGDAAAVEALAERPCSLTVREPPPPPPPFPPPEVVRRGRALAAAFVWAAPHGVVCIAQLVLNSKGSLVHYGDPNFPLLNLGRQYSSQPWRPVTSLFVSSHAVNAIVNYAAQLALTWFAIVGTPELRVHHVCALFLVSGSVGTVAAGLVLPDQPLNAGYVMTGVIAMYVLLVREPVERPVIVGATAAAIVSVVASLARHADVASHVVASLTCAFLYQAVAGSRPQAGSFCALAVSMTLATLMLAKWSAPRWLQDACAPQFDFRGVF
jgi:hypothetical protein